jgi:excisionase family DNA binding protein
MSHTISPEERSSEWRETSAQRGEVRERRLRYLAAHMLVELRSEFDLYGGYADEFVETLLTLDRHDALFDHEMMTAYQFLGATDDSGARLLALIAGRLAVLADADAAVPETRTRAAALAEIWRERVQSAEDEAYLTVAQVAARYAVTPQAVYKWIQKGKIEAEETPGGSYRVPAAQFTTSRAALERRIQTRRRLNERSAEEPLTDEEVAERIRETRREQDGL